MAASINTLKAIAKLKKKADAQPLKAWLHGEFQAVAEHGAISFNCFKFIAAFEYMCCGPKTPNGADSKVFRKAAWSSLDVNGNGHVSLAEAGKWILEHLTTTFGNAEEGKMLYKAYYPCFIRAFLDAADYGENKRVGQKGNKFAGTATTDDWVQFNEFRLLCSYLVIYAVIWDAFCTLDGGGAGVTDADDRRIDFAEFQKGMSTLKGHPFLSIAITAEADPAYSKQIFAQMDEDKHGKVLLGEFCKFIEDREFALKTTWGVLLNAGEPEVDVSADMAAVAAPDASAAPAAASSS